MMASDASRARHAKKIKVDENEEAAGLTGRLSTSL